MLPNWDRDKPEGMNLKSWRRNQVEKYVKAYPGCKPKDVLLWIRSQTPDP